MSLTVSQTLSFFKSVIHSGEAWSSRCQEAFDEAQAALRTPPPDQSRDAGTDIADLEGQRGYYGRVFQPDQSRGGEPVAWPCVSDYVHNYEFRGDYDYAPNEHEQALIEDAIHGYISDIEQARTPIPLTEGGKLPCDVHLPVNTYIRKGCSVETLMLAINKREKFPADATVFLITPTEGELIAVYDEYVKLLTESEKGMLGLAHAHGYRCPDELVQRGKELRERIARLKADRPTEGELHPNTKDLIEKLSWALEAKLLRAQKKYGYSNGWLTDDWQAECLEHLHQHIEKGDPLDVVAYAAFMWARGWPTSAPPTEGERVALAEDGLISVDELFARVEKKILLADGDRDHDNPSALKCNDTMVALHLLRHLKTERDEALRIEPASLRIDATEPKR